MGSCLVIGNKLQPKRDITIPLLGLDNAGKSTLLANLLKRPTEDIQTTVGLVSHVINKGRYRIRILDLGGGPDIRGIWHHYYAETHGIIFVVDSSNRDRLEEAQEVLWETLRDERMRGKPLLILANKQDQLGALEPDDIIDKLKLSELIRELSVSVHMFPTRVWSSVTLKSATPNNKQDTRINRALIWMLSLVAQDWERLDGRVRQESTAEREAEEQARLERRRRRQEREQAEEEAERAAGHVADEEEADGPRQNPFKPIKQVVREINAAEQAKAVVLVPVAAIEQGDQPPDEDSHELATRTDSGVSLHIPGTVEEEPSHTGIPVHAEGGEGSKDDTSISQAPKPLHKPSKRQSTKLLHRLKNRNKTVPVSDDKSLPSVSSFPPSALTNAPPLSAPWVTPGMDLEKEVLPSTPGGRIVRRGSPMLGMRLPKLVQPASSTSDISHSPELPPINSIIRPQSTPFHLADDISLNRPLSTR